MEREANNLLDAAGYQLQWRDLSLGSSEAVLADIVVVELRGMCEPPHRPDLVTPLAVPSNLASTAISNGEVLPFSWVECETLSRFLAAPLSKAESKQDYLYGRAMGRVVAHELYHVLRKTRDHDTDGVAKSHFSANDVLAEHFSFDAPALAKLREPSDAASGGTEELEESGR
jgi:hypothetical protein